MNKFVHYGHTEIDRNFTVDAYKKEMADDLDFYMLTNKPTGLWGCPCDAKRNWKNFVKHNQYADSTLLKTKFYFKVTDFSKIPIIKNDDDFLKIFNKYLILKGEDLKIDWKSFMEDYDGVIIYISNMRDWRIQYSLELWDVDSIIVWNLEKVTKI